MAEPSYNERYARPGWYWGTKPTALAREVVRLAPRAPGAPRVLIDLGSGEGRDSIYFARNGFRVTGVDISKVGAAKAQRRADRLGLNVRFRVGDLRTYRLERRADVVFSSGALNNLPPRVREARFAHFKRQTVPGGIHAMNAFVPKPYLRPPPEMDPAESPFRSGELLGYYWDWAILDSGEVEFDCNSSGIPHRHAMDVVLAREPDGTEGRTGGSR
jgi:tellurite methyltransferase